MLAVFFTKTAHAHTVSHVVRFPSMKIKVLCRNPYEYFRQRKSDIHKLPRNLDPALHPLEAPREYVRALNATKLNKVFAKPFLGSLSGHTDGVYCMCKHPKRLSSFLSGSCDGEIKLWDLAKQECVSTITAHTGFVRGLCMNQEGGRFISVGDDKIIKQWSYSDTARDDEWEPESTILCKSVLMGVDHHQKEAVFVTCGDKVEVWDEARSEPIASFSWGVDSVSHVRFNPVETNVIASCCSDRSVALYDIRQATPLQKVVLALRSNSLCWNPMEAYHFTIANEDSHLYSFDMRRLDRPVHMYIDHVNAVLDVDYSPTGAEFVSGGFDKTLRIFQVDQRHSREVYHTKRMQKIFCVKWSSDTRYILSGSDETNIRLWKAQASEKLGRLTRRERVALEYSDKLKEKYHNHPQIRRIARHRHVPKLIHKLTQERKIMLASRKRKAENRARHSQPGSTESAPPPQEKMKHIVEVVE